MVSKIRLLKVAAYFSECVSDLCDLWILQGLMQASMQCSVFFHVFTHLLQKAGINEVTKFTNDYLLMIMQCTCTKGNHEKMKKNSHNTEKFKTTNKVNFSLNKCHTFLTLHTQEGL